MIYPVWQQFLILSAAMAGGFLIALFFDAAEALRLLLHLPKKKPLYIVLWLLCAAAFFAIWLQLFHGAFRLLYFLWLGLGYAIYHFALDNPLRRLARKKAPANSPIIGIIKLLGRGDSRIYALFLAMAKFFIKIAKFFRHLFNRLAALIPKKPKKE